MLRKDLLDVLACPKCKGKLLYKNDLFCKKCKLKFTVRGDIPDMLIEHAEKLL